MIVRKLVLLTMTTQTCIFLASCYMNSLWLHYIVIIAVNTPKAEKKSNIALFQRDGKVPIDRE